MYKNVTQGLLATSGMSLLPQLGGSNGASNFLSIVFGVLFVGLAVTQTFVALKKHRIRRTL